MGLARFATGCKLTTRYFLKSQILIKMAYKPRKKWEIRVAEGKSTIYTKSSHSTKQYKKDQRANFGGYRPQVATRINNRRLYVNTQ